jgi:hypothetical protein
MNAKSACRVLRSNQGTLQRLPLRSLQTTPLGLQCPREYSKEIRAGGVVFDITSPRIDERRDGSDGYRSVRWLPRSAQLRLAYRSICAAA